MRAALDYRMGWDDTGKMLPAHFHAWCLRAAFGVSAAASLQSRASSELFSLVCSCSLFSLLLWGDECWDLPAHHLVDVTHLLFGFLQSPRGAQHWPHNVKNGRAGVSYSLQPYIRLGGWGGMCVFLRSALGHQAGNFVLFGESRDEHRSWKR